MAGSRRKGCRCVVRDAVIHLGVPPHCTDAYLLSLLDITAPSLTPHRLQIWAEYSGTMSTDVKFTMSVSLFSYTRIASTSRAPGRAIELPTTCALALCF